jgi:hypothetical protein
LATAGILAAASLSVLGGVERQRLRARCVLEAGLLTASERVTSGARDNGVTTSYEAYHACNAPNERADALHALIGVLAVTLLAGAIAWLQPGWKIRRQRLRALRRDDDPELYGALHDLTRVAGLRRPPTFLLDPLGRGLPRRPDRLRGRPARARRRRRGRGLAG